MPINTRELIALLAQICDENDLKVCIIESIKGAVLTGVVTVIGGLLFGPAGLAVGGAIGGGIAAGTSKGKFKPASEILLSLPDDKKQKLCRRIEIAFKDFGWSDLIPLASFIISQQSLTNLAFEEVKRHLTNELHYTIQ